MSEQNLHFSTYRKHMIVCTGDKCASPEMNQPLYQHLKDQLKILGADRGPDRIHRSKSSCLGVCQGGPVAVVYPEGVWYKNLDVPKMDRIIKEHLLEDKPVLDSVFHQFKKSGD